MFVDAAVWTVSPRRTVIETPGNGLPSPVMVPLTTHAAAAGGACCAPSPTPARTTAIATALAAVVDIPSMPLLPSTNTLGAAYVRSPPVPMTKRCQEPQPHDFLLSLLALNVCDPVSAGVRPGRRGWQR